MNDPITTASDVPWTGVLAVLDTPARDRPTLGTPLTPPFVLPMYFFTLGNDGQRAGLGVVDRVEVEGDNVVGHGRIDGTDPHADSILRALRAAGDAGLPCGLDGDASDDTHGFLFTTWRVRCLCVYDDPARAAFPTARIRLTA